MSHHIEKLSAIANAAELKNETIYYLGGRYRLTIWLSETTYFVVQADRSPSGKGWVHWVTMTYQVSENMTKSHETNMITIRRTMESIIEKAGK